MHITDTIYTVHLIQICGYNLEYQIKNLTQLLQ